MTYDELQRHIGKAGLRSNEFARLLGMNPISISNMRKRGEVSRHLAVVAVLLGEMAERGIDFRSMLSQIDSEQNDDPNNNSDVVTDRGGSDIG